MEPVIKSVCDERHERVNERCNVHNNQINELSGKIDCILKNQGKFHWLIVAALIALIVDIVRGFFVLDNVMKVVGK